MLGAKIRNALFAPVLVCGAALHLCGAASASAAIYAINLSDSRGYVANFWFDTANITYVEGRFFYDQSGDYSVYFYNQNYLGSENGPINFELNSNRTSYGNGFTGAQLYTGPESSPILKQGSFVLQNFYAGGPNGTISISPAIGPGSPSPELGAGFLSLLAAGAALFFTRLRRPAGITATADRRVVGKAAEAEPTPPFRSAAASAGAVPRAIPRGRCGGRWRCSGRRRVRRLRGWPGRGRRRRSSLPAGGRPGARSG